LRVGFLPGVAADAGPDALFGGGEAAHLGFEPVPEGGAVFGSCVLPKQKLLARHSIIRPSL
jgi:hypothetical protein